jgi:malonyl-CoA reductase/3-hydroxypropionate dehydrogenase (NADP+)
MSDNENGNRQRGRARMDGKVVILTGAAGNIGTYISRSLLREGARLVMTGRNEDKLTAFIDDSSRRGLRSRLHGTRRRRRRRSRVCREIVATAVEHFGKIDVLVNNAGAAGPRRTLRDIPFSGGGDARPRR